MSCSVCRNRNVVEGYSITTITYSKTRIRKMWCQECLTLYASGNIKFNANYMPKLRDTDITAYNDMISSDEFIAEAFKQVSY